MLDSISNYIFDFNSDITHYEYKDIVSMMKKFGDDIVIRCADEARIEGFQMINGKKIDFKEDDGVIFQGEDQTYPELEILIKRESILKVKDFIIE